MPNATDIPMPTSAEPRSGYAAAMESAAWYERAHRLAETESAIRVSALLRERWLCQAIGFASR